MDIIISFYNDSIGPFLPKEIFLIILSTIPFIELRGGMIAASLLKIPYLQAVLLCLAGNTIPIPFVLVLGRRILQLLKRNQTTAFIGKAIEDKVAMKSAIKGSGLEVGNIEYIEGDDSGKEVITSQDPQPGEETSKGEQISLTVSIATN